MFRYYDAEKVGFLDRAQTFEILKEIDGLYTGNEKKTQGKSFKMSDLQFDQLYTLIDEDKNGKLTPDEIPGVVSAYETWLYERNYLSTMEDLWSEGNGTIGDGNFEAQLNDNF